MKLYFLLTVFLLTSLSIFSQENYLSIANPEIQKEIRIENGKRIRIKTNEGKKISGKFEIIDEETILIKKNKILISDITKIKRNPLGLTLPISIISGNYAYLSLVVAILGPIVGSLLGEEDSELFLLFLIPSAALMYNTVKPINPLKGYKPINGWEIKINKSKSLPTAVNTP